MTARNILMSAAGGSVDANYIEDVFSTWLYTGTGATQPINNGIDLAGKGGLVWTKNRTGDSTAHALIDTARGIGRILNSNNTGAQSSVTADTTAALTTFNSNGYTLGSDSGNWGTNFNSSYTYVSWTFRRQPKFFDIVTYTGNGTDGRAISHNLGSTPGCIITKATSTTSNWLVYHRGNPFSPSEGLALNLTASTNSIYSSGTPAPTSSVFYAGASAGGPTNNGNVNGVTYVAYLFAHNAGGFGLTGTDNVISCGSWTGNATFDGSATVNLGYEPQFLMWKNASADQDWNIQDNMRGFTAGSTNSPASPGAILVPNSSAAEVNPTTGQSLTSTGFALRRDNSAGNVYIYVAIRRGPMKVPTTGTSVFAPVVYNGNDSARVITTGFVTDLTIPRIRSATYAIGAYWFDRLRGALRQLRSTNTESEASLSESVTSFANMAGVSLGSAYQVNASGDAFVTWNFRRAPGFFDEVCYTGTGSARTVAHNLTVVPELMIFKNRSGTDSWPVYAAPLVATNTVILNASSASQATSNFNNTTPTASVFSVGQFSGTNASGNNYVAYLFATCPGVSKVGSYTGNGTSQTIDCSFTAGARFIMIKRTNVDGDWYVWDTARGITAGNDPRFSLNSTAAEVAGDDSVDPQSSGFIVNQVAATNINVSGSTYLFLAIA